MRSLLYHSFLALAVFPLGACTAVNADPDHGSSASGITTDGMVEVQCLATDTPLTDLEPVREALGVDYVGVFVKPLFTESSVHAQSSGSCDSTCMAAVEQAHAQIDASTRPPAEEDAPWRVPPSAGGGPGSAVLVIGNDGEYSAVFTPSALRALLGALDTPWKAYLWLYVTSNVDVSCQPVKYFVYSGTQNKSFVSAATPNEFVGLVPPALCTNDEVIAYRVRVAVSEAGEVSENAREEIWRGTTGCP